MLHPLITLITGKSTGNVVPIPQIIPVPQPQIIPVPIIQNAKDDEEEEDSKTIIDPFSKSVISEGYVV